MNRDSSLELDRLRAVLRRLDAVAVATSGGVDSTTLAFVAHRELGAACEIFHAVSAAVPPEATERLRATAAGEGWQYREVDAGELADPAYVANPTDRCYHCKTNLYDTVGAATSRPVASGTNLDDLDDFRPGLRAAAEHQVVHPFVEAGIDKNGIRAIAREVGLVGFADLPASPCLSSRIETGIAIRPELLTTAHRVERAVTGYFEAGGARPDHVRCRITAAGVEVQVDAELHASLDTQSHERLVALAGEIGTAQGLDLPVRVGPYRQGSAFLHLD